MHGIPTRCPGLEPESQTSIPLFFPISQDSFGAREALWNGAVTAQSLVGNERLMGTMQM